MELNYHPALLGIEKRRESNGKEALPKVPSWREGLEQPRFDGSQHHEQEILNRLQRASSAETRLWTVLGEPGAGKTRLVTEWFKRWASQVGTPAVGLRVPVLIWLRSLEAEDLKLDPELFADLLWTRGVHERPVGDGPVDTIYRHGRQRLFEPVWLLDGLDEVRPNLLGPDLPSKLAALPGVKLVTCRTAVFQTLREAMARYQQPDAEYRILPLTEAQQLSLLSTQLTDPIRVAALSQAIKASEQLRMLAGNPLMLSLIAQIFEESTEPLPQFRATFYEAAAKTMWHRRLSYKPALLKLRGQRDAVLTELARQIELNAIEAETTVLDRAIAVAEANPAIWDALAESGLLVVDDRRERVRFCHLTFQEYYLARAWVSVGWQKSIEQHWHDPRYEETLSLMLSMLVARDRRSEIEAPLRRLVDWGRLVQRTDPQALRRLGKSPLRVSLYLMQRANLGMTELGRTGLRLLRWIRRSRPVAKAIAQDDGMPGFLLTDLARHRDWQVCYAIACNAATPPGALAVIARHRMAFLRGVVASRHTTPPDVLVALAQDPETSVRRHVADNPATPSQALIALAEDPAEGVQRALGQRDQIPPELLVAFAHSPDAETRLRATYHPATPPEALAALACDLDARVRAQVAQRHDSPPAVLAALAQDIDAVVRQHAGWSRNTPLEVREILAKDPDARVRRAAATEAPPQLLMVLAQDPDAGVRAEVARDTATPPELVALLAQDPDPHVRIEVAWRAATNPEQLPILARHPEAAIRIRVAMNSATPPDMLAVLAQDPNADVRLYVAWNNATPPRTLVTLTQDPDASIRQRVRWNAAAPPEAFVALAKDPSVSVRREVVRWAGTPSEALAVLAHDSDAEIRRAVARDYTTPSGVLALLAQDTDTEVRRHVARNGATPVEALTLLASDPDESIRCKIAERTATRVLLEKLARDSAVPVRRHVASNVATPREVLAVLARDPESSVRRDVASTRTTPSSILAILVQDRAAEVREAAVSNRSTILEDLSSFPWARQIYLLFN